MKMGSLAVAVLAAGSAFGALPEGYETVDFVATDGAQYIDTGVAVTDGLRVDIDFMYTRDTSRHILGQRAKGDAQDVNPTVIKQRYRVTEELSGAGDGTLYLFARNDGGVAANLAFARLYGAKLSQDGAILRDYRPCRRLADGVLGLYEQVGGTFHPSAGAKPFFRPWRVGIYGGEGAKGGSIITWYQLVDRSPECDLVVLSPALMQEGTILGTLDAVVMPGGSSKDELASLGKDGQENLKKFIADGGCYFGTCAGAHLVLEDELNISGYKTLGAEKVAKRAEVCFNDEGMKELGITQKVWNISYSRGPFITDGIPVEGANLKVWGTYCNTGERKNAKGFPMEGRYAFLGGTYFKGRMIITSSHPEYRSEKALDITPLIRQGFRWLSGRDDIMLGEYTDGYDAKAMNVFLDTSYSGIFSSIEAILKVGNDPRMNLVKGVAAAQLNDARYKDLGRAMIFPSGVVGVEGTGEAADKAAARAFKERGGLCLFMDDGLTADELWTILDALASDRRAQKAQAWTGTAQSFSGDRTFEGLDLRISKAGEWTTSFADGVFAFTANGSGLGGDWVYCADPLIHRVVVSNACVSAGYGNHRRSSFCTVTPEGVTTGVGAIRLEVVLGGRNVTDGPAALTFAKSLTIAAQSTISVKAHGKAPGSYKIIEAGELKLEEPSFLDAAVIDADEGRHAALVRTGNAIVLRIEDGNVQ